MDRGDPQRIDIRLDSPLALTFRDDLREVHRRRHLLVAHRASQRFLRGSGDELDQRVHVGPVFGAEENIRQTADFLRTLGKMAQRIELMPYYRPGEGKYASIGRRYRLHRMLPMDQEQVEIVTRALEDSGIRCTVSS